MKFFKYSGSGNDFILFDNRDSSLELSSGSVMALCRRRQGVGADGVVLINSSKMNDFEMQIFNADGSEAEMCGNGARCSVHFAYYILKMKTERTFVFDTMNGVYEGEVTFQNEIKVKMTELYDLDSINLSDLGRKNTLYLNTGVPHAVIQVSSVDDVDVRSMGEVIRSDARFPSGANVDFFEVLEGQEQAIKLRVYERGVEGETLCCGTGIMAAAISCANFFNWSGAIKVYARGGLLKAIVEKNSKDFYFQGGVEMLFYGDIEL